MNMAAESAWDMIVDQIAARVEARLLPRLLAALKNPSAPHGAREGERLLSVEEAADRLGLSVSTLYKRAERGALASVRDGGRLLFRSTDLDAYVEARRRSPEKIALLAAAIQHRRGASRHLRSAARSNNVIQNVADNK